MTICDSRKIFSTKVEMQKKYEDPAAATTEEKAIGSLCFLRCDLDRRDLLVDYLAVANRNCCDWHDHDIKVPEVI
jgi:hypothetical protein